MIYALTQQLKVFYKIYVIKMNILYWFLLSQFKSHGSVLAIREIRIRAPAAPHLNQNGL